MIHLSHQVCFISALHLKQCGREQTINKVLFSYSKRKEQGLAIVSSTVTSLISSPRFSISSTLLTRLHHQFQVHLFLFKHLFRFHITRGPCAFPQGVSAVLFHCCLGSIFSPVVHVPPTHAAPFHYHHHLLPQLTQFVSSSPSSTTLSPPHIIIPNPLIPTGTQITTGYQP
jgi:hypothetical protein